MRVNRRHVLQFGAAVATLSWSSGFALGQRKTRIAFANYNDEAAFGGLVLEGIKVAAAKMPDVELILYNNRSDPGQVVQNARTVATVKPDVFIEYNATAPKANPQVKRIVEEAGVPILSVQVPIEGTPLFAVDNVAAGRESGMGVAQAARKRWGEEEPAVLILALPEAGEIFKLRSDAATLAIGEVYPNASPTEFSTKDDDALARSIVSAFLIKNPERKVIIWVHEDSKAIAALTAARDAQRESDVVIGSTGGQAIILPLIRAERSPIVGTFSYFPDRWGDDIMPLAVKMAKGEEVPEVSRPTLQTFVTRENIDKLYPGN